MARAQKSQHRDKGAAFDQAMEIRIQSTLGQIGERVRAARKEKAMTRQELSVRSGVSMRYLAQLESGEGNVSVGLLQRIAAAVDRELSGLVCEKSPAAHDHIALHYAKAPEQVKQQVRRLLRLDDRGKDRAGRVCLIGLRGAGKSTLGALLGAHFKVPFIQLNNVIEEHAGMPVNEIHALYGQDGFRTIEAEALNRISRSENRMVLEASGGIVSEPATYAVLLERFHTIWIKARPQEHMQRVIAQGDTRPMSGNPEAMKQLNRLLEIRHAQYSQADAILDTSDQTLETSIQQLCELIEARAFFHAQDGG